ncbi:gp436 family protein [Acinetobacter ursingii]|uniref:gp436 family protein n=1 Tax=Acinetobacter ursingii TaxID=108980 RepID=UPI003AF4EC8E
MYATVDAMLRKFGEGELIQLTDTEAPYGHVINYDKLNAAMIEANSEIDGYLAGRYKLPLPAVPPFLESIGCHMARYYACTGAISENDPIKTRYDNALKSLKEIAKGTIAVGGTPTGEAAPVKTSSNNVMFQVGRHDWGGNKW